VNPVTLQRLAAVGKLDVRKDENGHWRFSKVSLEKWDEKRRTRRLTSGTQKGDVQSSEVRG